MALKLIIDSLEGLSDSVKELYKEKDGKFHLDVDGIEDTSGLKNKVKELLDETKSEREKRIALEREKQEAEEARQKEKGEFRELYEKAQADLQKERSEIQEFKQRIQQKDIDAESFNIAYALSKDKARAALIHKEIRSYAKHTDEGVIFEIGGVKVDTDKIKAKISEDYPFLVDGNGASGGGASGGQPNGGAMKKFNEYTGAELSEIRKTNPAAYEKLKTEYYQTK